VCDSAATLPLKNGRRGHRNGVVVVYYFWKPEAFGCDWGVASAEEFVPLVFPSAHPVVHHKIAALRATRTGVTEFRRLVRSLAVLIAQEATADLPTQPVEVTTPMGTAAGRVLADKVGIVPILRAGLGMADGVLDLIPDAEVWHIGLFRDEQTLRPTEYYNKLPLRPRVTLALVVDPMLATGGSAVRTCEVLKAAGVARLKFLALIAAPEGIARMAEAMPDVAIHVGVIDSHLNEVGFICPGLGDAGDRQFGTGLVSYFGPG
jgi:uracil phosphoribosyltransferase